MAVLFVDHGTVHVTFCGTTGIHETTLTGRVGKTVRRNELPWPVDVFDGDDVPCVPYSTFGSQQPADCAADAVARANSAPAREPRHDCAWPESAYAVGLAHGGYGTFRPSEYVWRQA